MLSAEEITDN